eukprot:CAMPEP_0203696770 /NCGR_PEP_ID=MMETSP0091-20130426/7898_1 /ASSEMBLY_ACC=CAM_ASM_001089 /TAXON_ID=426623 /ORGANISM="Chaetoceros affinis, Strain CCMP159" /LENGTH=53 /DNA_ID=CAMNT_0050568605 /DNA_START=27 /DNA_END=188 /DNA_ORIENTATION=-
MSTSNIQYEVYAIVIIILIMVIIFWGVKFFDRVGKRPGFFEFFDGWIAHFGRV